MSITDFVALFASSFGILDSGILSDCIISTMLTPKAFAKGSIVLISGNPSPVSLS